MCTHLRELSKSFPMNINMTGFRWFWKIFASLCICTKVVASALEGLTWEMMRYVLYFLHIITWFFYRNIQFWTQIVWSLTNYFYLIWLSPLSSVWSVLSYLLLSDLLHESCLSSNQPPMKNIFSKPCLITKLFWGTWPDSRVFWGIATDCPVSHHCLGPDLIQTM